MWAFSNYGDQLHQGSDLSFVLQSRTKIINKLCRRSRGEIEMAEMTELLDTLKLKQLCVDLKGVENPKISQDFARDVLGLETRLSEGEGL